MSMNDDFKASPEGFLKLHTVHTGGRIAGSGNKKVGFALKGDAIILEEDPKGFDCYYLATAKGEANTSCLDRATKEAQHFFTDSLTGCQFLAYGGSVKPIVEHSNDPGGFDQHLKAARGQDLLCSVTPGKDYADDEIANVVGVRQGGRWAFYLQHGKPGAPTVRKLS